MQPVLNTVIVTLLTHFLECQGNRFNSSNRQHIQYMLSAVNDEAAGEIAY